MHPKYKRVYTKLFDDNSISLLNFKIIHTVIYN